jgi:MFS family permease
MNLVMTSSPLAVVGCGFQVSDASNIVSAHVIAMYLPSFFTGYVIVAIGVERVVGLGLFILACAGAVALSGVELPNFYLALVLLGIGWNFGFIGATTLLTSAHAPHERGRVQGMNDAIVFGSVTVASLASGGLMNCSGADAVHGWNAVNLAMIPFLALAGAALIWLTLRPKPREILASPHPAQRPPHQRSPPHELARPQRPVAHPPGLCGDLAQDRSRPPHGAQRGHRRPPGPHPQHGQPRACQRRQIGPLGQGQPPARLQIRHGHQPGRQRPRPTDRPRGCLIPSAKREA